LLVDRLSFSVFGSRFAFEAVHENVRHRYAETILFRRRKRCIEIAAFRHFQSDRGKARHRIPAQCHHHVKQPMSRRLRAAIEAAAYEHAKFTAVAVGYMDGDFGSRLDRAIARSRAPLMIELRLCSILRRS
jgi:hypothetical protein